MAAKTANKKQNGQAKKPSNWKNRIVGEDEINPDQLLANPKNWRIHPKDQQDALGTVLDRVGWVQKVIVNQATGFVVDGHLRVAMAISKNEATIPVSYVDLSDEEEALVLATIDPLSALAITDDAQIQQLVDDINPDDEVQNLLMSVKLPVSFTDTDSPIKSADQEGGAGSWESDDYRCPNCLHEWSGAPKPVKQEKELQAKKNQEATDADS
jgi:hypothetical protein